MLTVVLNKIANKAISNYAHCLWYKPGVNVSLALPIINTRSPICVTADATGDAFAAYFADTESASDGGFT